MAERVRRRDRRGRGVRGDLLPAHLPGHRTPAEQFDDLVLDSVDRLGTRWSEELDAVDVVVEDIPPGDPAPWEQGPVLGAARPAPPGGRATLVVYRRPVTARADDELPRLVHVVVVEQLATLLGRTPDEVDPEWDVD